MKKKTIFTTITLGLVTLLGFGFLGTINSQPKEVKASEITTPNKKYAKVNNLNNIFDSDNTYYFVAKGYANNGRGTFYDGDTIDINTSRYMSSYSAGLQSVEFNLIANGQTTKYYLSIQTTQGGGGYKLAYVILSNSYVNGNYYEPNWAYLYHVSNGSFNRQYSAFVGKGPFNVVEGNREYTINYISQLFNVYEMENEYFEFADTINYNSPYSQDIDSFVVYDTYFNNSSVSMKQVVLLENTPFYSGGYVFDKIILYYDKALGTKFRTESNNILEWSEFNYGIFVNMFYLNTATQFGVAVNERIYEAYYNNTQSGLYITKNSKWVSKNYQKIQFFVDISEQSITELSKLNNSSYTGGYYNNTGVNIGLGNAFALISQAFTAWLPILQVTIVPGITLGLLLFLPLIAGIVIFIIWIVKR